MSGEKHVGIEEITDLIVIINNEGTIKMLQFVGNFMLNVV